MGVPQEESDDLLHVETAKSEKISTDIVTSGKNSELGSDQSDD
jgi:hypothetical protein